MEKLEYSDPNNSKVVIYGVMEVGFRHIDGWYTTRNSAEEMKEFYDLRDPGGLYVVIQVIDRDMFVITEDLDLSVWLNKIENMDMTITHFPIDPKFFTTLNIN